MFYRTIIGNHRACCSSLLKLWGMMGSRTSPLKWTGFAPGRECGAYAQGRTFQPFAVRGSCVCVHLEGEMTISLCLSSALANDVRLTWPVPLRQKMVLTTQVVDMSPGHFLRNVLHLCAAPLHVTCEHFQGVHRTQLLYKSYFLNKLIGYNSIFGQG